MSTSYSQEDRIDLISSRLHYTYIDNEYKNKLEILTQRCNQLKNAMSNIQEEIEQRVIGLQGQLQQLKDAFGEELEVGEQYFTVKNKELKQLETSLNEILQQTLCDRREIDLKYRKILEERANSLQQETLREAGHRKEAAESISGYLNDKITHIQGLLIKESTKLQKSRTENGIHIAKETARTVELVVQEKQAREESEEELLKTLQEVFARLKGDVELERNNRESCEETLLGLLEETCGKLNVMSN